MNRRLFLGGTLALGAPALVLGGCGDEDTEGTPAADAGLLNEALSVELSSVALYEAGAETLAGSAAETAERFAEIEAQHVAVLRGEIEAWAARSKRDATTTMTQAQLDALRANGYVDAGK